MSEITQHESTKKDTGTPTSHVAMVVVTVLLITLIFLPILMA